MYSSTHSTHGFAHRKSKSTKLDKPLAPTTPAYSRCCCCCCCCCAQQERAMPNDIRCFMVVDLASGNPCLECKMEQTDQRNVRA